MDLPGLRYRVLATRCRQSAEVARCSADRSALFRMATAYDRKAAEIERDLQSRLQMHAYDGGDPSQTS